MPINKRNENRKPIMVDNEALEEALNLFGTRGRSLWLVFILVSIPGVFSIWHLTSYVFLGAAYGNWCVIPELRGTNWTNQQIRNISIPKKKPEVAGDYPVIPEESCSIYAWDYAAFANKTFEEAWESTGFTEATYDKPGDPKIPAKMDCTKWNYEKSGESIVEEWDLVCDRALLRSTSQMVVTLGKFVGSLLFGYLADNIGRRKSILLACLIYLVSGYVSSFAPWFSVFLMARFLLGVAGTGTYNCGFTLLNEVCVTSRRATLGILSNMSYPVGEVTLALIAYYIRPWRIFSLVLNLPMIVLLFHFCLLPESPRWLISQGKQEKAWEVVKHVARDREVALEDGTGAADEVDPVLDALPDSAEGGAPVPVVEGIPRESRWYRRAKVAIFESNLISLLNNSELRRRMYICLFTWCIAGMTYFALSLNAVNFGADIYSYVAIVGVVEAISYMVPIPLLRLIGRRLASGILYIACGTSLLFILAIPRENSSLIVTVAMIGRLCNGAVYAVLILHTSELFPTVNRNTAVGIISTMSYVGALIAPYIVDILGKVRWYIPSTICGITSIIAGLLSMMLPETRDRELCNTVQEVNEKKGEDCVSLRNCWRL